MRAPRNRLGLTAAQHRCVRLIVAGHTEKSAGQVLGLTAHTVGAHIDEVRRIFDVSSQAELTREILRLAGIDVIAAVDMAAGVTTRESA